MAVVGLLFGAACGNALVAAGEEGGANDAGNAEASLADVSSADAAPQDAVARDTEAAETQPTDASDASDSNDAADASDSNDSNDATDASDASDASDAPAGCDPSKAFGTLALVANVNLLGSDQPSASLDADELTIYLTRHATAVSSAIYVASRALTTDAFGSPVLLPGSVDTTGSQAASLPSDGLTLYFDPVISPATTNRIWTATRATRSSTFGAPAALATVNSSATDTEPFVLPDGRTLYFASNRAGPPFRIFRAALDASAPAVEVAELTSAYQAMNPVVSADELTIYFASDRGGGGSYNIWRARRLSTSLPFGAPTDVTELNTLSTELPAWISADACRMLFISNRGGDLDVWSATR